MSEEQVEAPVEVEAPTPVEEPKKVPAKKAAPKAKSHNFDLPDEEVHRRYFIPPAGYVKPKFPSSF